MKKALISALGLAIAAGTLIAAPSASAAARAAQDVECSTWKSSTAPYRGYAKCTGMTLYIEGVQVKVTCINPRGGQWTIYGPTKGNGKTSSEKCSDDPSIGVYKVGVRRVRI